MENLKGIKEAVKVLEMCIIPLEPDNKSVRTLLDLARSHIAAVEGECLKKGLLG